MKDRESTMDEIIEIELGGVLSGEHLALIEPF